MKKKLSHALDSDLENVSGQPSFPALDNDSDASAIPQELFSDYDSAGMVSPQKTKRSKLSRIKTVMHYHGCDKSERTLQRGRPEDRQKSMMRSLIIIDSCSERYGSRQASAHTLIRKPFKRPVLANIENLNKAFKLPIRNLQSSEEQEPINNQRRQRVLSLGMLRRPLTQARPLHDHEVEGNIVLYAPPEVTTEQELALLKSHALNQANGRRVHVVVDPIIGNRLRPHQVEGVQFLYDCLTGAKEEGAYGCIIADEMGLGKTLQCIAVLWTMLKQSPLAGKPFFEKAVIVCPSSLVRNWAKELVKWLGASRIQPLACDGGFSREEATRELQSFMTATGRAVRHPVLIISYDTLRQYSAIMQSSEIGLLLADEGHRLKNKDTNTYGVLHSLKVKRRVIMSGTPIQNDLTEYFALLNFANPNLLGSEKDFHREFELPILRGRDRGASDSEKQLAETQLSKLYDVANKFIIRRTAELLTNYLPVKYEHIVFCGLSSRQRRLYKLFLSSKLAKMLLCGTGSQPLKAVTMLRKLCNHHTLLNKSELGLICGKETAPTPNEETDGGKALLLERMLTLIKAKTDDKIVLISNYVQTLDLLERVCHLVKLSCLRLDGSMSIKKRQTIVDRFNKPGSPERVFLLSSKAGGCGINLIGGNRLVLFDPDWNPASDLQALARIWREGQQKTCYIYRLVATGTIEEKVLMRQAHKQSLSSVVVDEEQQVERHFSLQDLQKLFQLSDDTLSEMHDVFRCKRCINNRQVFPPEEKLVNTGAQALDSSTWNHFSQLELNKVNDPILRAASKGIVTYVFQNRSHQASASPRANPIGRECDS